VNLWELESKKHITVIDKLITYYEGNPKRWIQHEGQRVNAKGHLLGCCILGGFSHFGKDEDGIISIDEQLDLANRVSKVTNVKSVVQWNDTVCKNAKQAIAFLKKARKAIKNELK
jgi:hypothetical protein